MPSRNDWHRRACITSWATPWIPTRIPKSSQSSLLHWVFASNDTWDSNFTSFNTQRFILKVTHAPGQNSVDYIVETPEVLVLTEVKSVSPSPETRYGVFHDGGDIDQKLNKACRQISRTAELIRGGHPDLPPSNGRPLRGLVVTREEYFNLPITAITNVIKPASIPTTVISSQKLEHVLAGLSKESSCGSLLLQTLAPDTDTIKTDLAPLPTDTNPLLSEIRDQWWESVRSLPS